MPVLINEFELLSAPPPPPPAPAVNAPGGQPNPPLQTPPAQAQRIAVERRERALRVFAH
ncbi:MAG: hypothetical protein U1F76_06885 [Candidatus Competibacteraceae bacterium]